MKPEIRRFVTTVVITSIISIITTAIIKYFFLQSYHLTSVYFLICYISLITILFHIMLLRAISTTNSLFVNRFIAFSGMKLMIYLFTIIIYIFFIKSEPVIFLLSFIMLYFIFTILEITSLLKFFKKILQ